MFLFSNFLAERRDLAFDQGKCGSLCLSFIKFRRALGRKILHIAEYLCGENFESFRPWSVIITKDGNVKCLLEGNHKAPGQNLD